MRVYQCYCKRDFSASFIYSFISIHLQIPPPGRKSNFPEPPVKTVNAKPTFVYVNELSIAIYHCTIKQQIWCTFAFKMSCYI